MPIILGIALFLYVLARYYELGPPQSKSARQATLHRIRAHKYILAKKYDLASKEIDAALAIDPTEFFANNTKWQLDNGNHQWLDEYNRKNGL